jgi:hypothetical protein
MCDDRRGYPKDRSATRGTGSAEPESIDGALGENGCSICGKSTLSAKLVTLETWAANIYGEDAPNMDTLRRWAREGKIFPAPKKQGRAYFLPEHAQPRRRRIPAAEGELRQRRRS